MRGLVHEIVARALCRWEATLSVAVLGPSSLRFLGLSRKASLLPGYQQLCGLPARGLVRRMEPSRSSMNTRILLPFVVLITVLSVETSDACRCAQRSLASYYRDADIVVLARVENQNQTAGDLSLRVAALTPPYKGALRPGTKFVTADNSGACGLGVQSAATYILFGRRTETADQYRVDTCSGSRRFPPSAGDSSTAFVDVPSKFVASQLVSLQALLLLADVAKSEPMPANPSSRRLIGLLDLKSLAHGGAIPLHASPAAESTTGERVEEISAFETREASYEFPAAIVYAKVPGWYRVRERGGDFVWLSADHAGTYWPYDELPIGRLSYLNEQWIGILWPHPGAGQPSRHQPPSPGKPGEIPVVVQESKRIGGSLWFRVGLLDADPCEGGTPAVGHSGWVPAYGIIGRSQSSRIEAPAAAAW